VFLIYNILKKKYNDIDLAKYNADKVENNDPLRKKLWISIVKHVIEEKKDIKTLAYIYIYKFLDF